MRVKDLVNHSPERIPTLRLLVHMSQCSKQQAKAVVKEQKDSKDGEKALPSASTCFFSLSLPEYSSKEQLKEKLLFAINNVTTMETDFQTNSAEIAEGYRAF